MSEPEPRVERHVIRFGAATAVLVGGFAGLVFTAFAITLGLELLTGSAPASNSLSTTALWIAALIALPSWFAVAWGVRAWRKHAPR
ncbi:MAG: hypothetical protein U1E50_02610 [Caulobacteraceae bacterium]